MEFKITSQQILNVLSVFSWIIFIGLSVEAGSFIVNGLFTGLQTPDNATYFGLTDLYRFDAGQFYVQLAVLSVIAMLKATLFYRIIMVLQERKLNFSQPFTKEIGRFLFLATYIIFIIGLFCNGASEYAKWFTAQGVSMPDIQDLGAGGGDVWLFMAVMLFVIAHIFKRGIEIQSENELTI